MKFREYGKQNQEVIFLLHGGGLSWWNYNDEISLLQKDYHVVIPLLDGHAGSDRPFTSIEDNASELCEYISERFGGSVFAIGGLSLGGQILIEMLSQAPNICKFALIESALVIPMTGTNRILDRSVRMSYGLTKKRWFAKMQFRQLRLRHDLFEDYFQDSRKITPDSMLAFLKCNTSYTIKESLRNTSAKAIVVVGEKEQKKLRDSADLIHGVLPGSRLLVMPGYYHGDFSINNSKQYCDLILSLAE